MTHNEFAAILDQTLEDYRLSRSEKRALTDVIADVGPDAQKLAAFRKLAFEKAANAANPDPQFKMILEWLEGVVKVLTPMNDETELHVEAHFSPSDRTCQRLVSFLKDAKRSLDVCVFTITDDRISREIVAAHRRNVAVRIITDDEKMHDLGSDIKEFQEAGIPVRMDDSTFHVHHKFAIADGRYLLTGSFNWTRSASMNNQENFIIINEPRLLAEFQREFEKLWIQFA